MKNFLMILITVALAFFAHYFLSSPSYSATTEITVDNFLDIAKADLATESSKSENVVFYESQITFSNFITSDTVGIERVMNVIQDTSMCIQFHHRGTKTYITKTHSYWLEDIPVNLDRLITLDSAITRLNMANVPKPKTRICILRNVLGPTPTTPAYIFGTHGTGFVRVDGYTGEVSTIE